MHKVLVTGGAGFIGSHIVDELLARGYAARIFDIWANPMQDVRNPWAILDAIKGCDAVMHLAAEPFIPYGSQDPTLFVETNINGTLNVLNATRSMNCERILIWSSSEIYGSARSSEGMDESHPTNPHSIYAVTKLAADRMAWTFHKETDLPVTIVRQFNCYGPRETQPYVIPTIIEQLETLPKLRLGNVEAERDFTYVKDAAEAAVDLLECESAIGEVVNVGSGATRSIRDIAIKLWSIMRPDEKLRLRHQEKDRLRPYDVDRLLCDNRKMRELTGWKPKTGFSQGLHETVSWYRTHGPWQYRHQRGE